MSECEWHTCKRPATRENGWSIRACYGHMIVMEANAYTHGEDAISAEEYKRRIEPARKWFKENPNE
jgi:hypothetical protein